MWKSNLDKKLHLLDHQVVENQLYCNYFKGSICLSQVKLQLMVSISRIMIYTILEVKSELLVKNQFFLMVALDKILNIINKMRLNKK